MTTANRQLVFNENMTSEVITVVIIQDNIPEDNENFFIIIRDPTEQNNSTIVKRANIMLNFGGKAKINIGMSATYSVILLLPLCKQCHLVMNQWTKDFGLARVWDLV